MSRTEEAPSVNDLAPLLQRVQAITERHRGERRQQDAPTSVWEILDRTTAEDRGHSYLLAAMLDPDGLNGQRGQFLNLFFDVLLAEGKIRGEQAAAYKAAKWQVRVDVPFKAADGEGDERFDILLCAKDKNDVIVIVNKVYADDQSGQLIRHWQYARELVREADPEHVVLLYLRPVESQPGDDSLGKPADPDRVSVKRCLKLISYKDTIAEWIDRCLAASALMPGVERTLCQYQDVITQLTGQSISKEMNMDITSLLTENPENLQAGIDAARAIGQAKASVQHRFWRTLEERLAQLGCTLVANPQYCFSESKTHDYYEKGRLDDGLNEFGIGILLPCANADDDATRHLFRLGLWIVLTEDLWYDWKLGHIRDAQDRPEWVDFDNVWTTLEAWDSLLAAFRRAELDIREHTASAALAWQSPRPALRTNFALFGKDCTELADDGKLIERTEGIAEEVMSLIERVPADALSDWRRACLDRVGTVTSAIASPEEPIDSLRLLDVSRAHAQRVLALCDGSKAHAAKQLGISDDLLTEYLGAGRQEPLGQLTQ